MKLVYLLFALLLLFHHAVMVSSFRGFTLFSGVVYACLFPHSKGEIQYLSASDTTLLLPSTPTRGLKSFVSKDYFREYNVPKTCLPFKYIPPTPKQSFWSHLALWFQYPWRRIQDKVFLKVSLSGSLSIQDDAFSLRGLFSKESISSLPELTQLCLLGAHDPRVEGLYIELSTLTCGYAKLDEALRWIHYFRQSGKPVIGYATRVNEKEVYLSRGFSEFYLPPLDNNMDLRGFSVSATFWRGIFHKLGIEPQVQRIGKYKSFGDVYLRESMSDAQREVMTQILYQESTHWLRNIVAEKHNVSEGMHKKNDINEFQSWLWSNVSVKDTMDYVRHPHFPLLSGVLYRSQMENIIHARFGKEKQLPWWKRWIYRRNKSFNETLSDKKDLQNEEIDIFKYTRRNLYNVSQFNHTNEEENIVNIDNEIPETSPKVTFFGANTYLSCMKNIGTHLLQGMPLVITSSGPRIAIVSLSGTITEGASLTPSFSTNEINAAALETFFETLIERDDIEGVVLYVDSPGGSADASDILWHKLRQLAKRKPLVACLSDVAASGGYYLAMACDQIVSEVMSLTGSIGVVLGKLNFEELFERKLGIKSETLSIGKFAELSSISKRFSKDEARYIELLAEKMYQSFVCKAAVSRGMNVSQMEKFAQGRVWTGQDAFANGLVDHLGGLWTAVDITDRLVKQEKQRRNRMKLPLESATNVSQSKPYRVEFMSENSKSLKNWFFGGLKSNCMNIETSNLLYLASDEVFMSDLGGVSADMSPQFEGILGEFNHLKRPSNALVKSISTILKERNFIRVLWSFLKNRKS